MKTRLIVKTFNEMNPDTMVNFREAGYYFLRDHKHKLMFFSNDLEFLSHLGEKLHKKEMETFI